MPTATPFAALGRGNGFPFCLTHATGAAIDALETDGGLQRKLRVNGTRAEIMQIFWNLYSLTASGDVSITLPPTLNDSFSDVEAFLDYDLFFDEFFNEYGYEPTVDPQSESGDRCVFNDNLVDIGYEYGAFPPADDGRPAIAPTFYYNTTDENFTMLFDFGIEIKSNFGTGTQYSDFYTSNEANWEGSILPVTFSLFGVTCTIYSEQGQITLSNFLVSDNYFTYT